MNVPKGDDKTLRTGGVTGWERSWVAGGGGKRGGLAQVAVGIQAVQHLRVLIEQPVLIE